jgi:hypothetical protein
VGYSELLSAVFDDISFCIVDEAKTDILPDGDLHMAWKGLLDMFEPSTPSSRLALKKQFQNSQLTSASLDPDIWITELELLRKRLKALKVTIDDEDFVMQIINNLPMEYDSLVEAIEEDMNKELTDQITVKRVRERLRARFRRMAMRNDDGNSPNIKHEVALTTAPKKFKGRCQLCGKFGHKKVDCQDNEAKPNKSFSSFGPSKSNNSNGKNPKEMICNYCKKKGHTEAYCLPRREKRRRVNKMVTVISF